jgi:hypothetical protein
MSWTTRPGAPSIRTCAREEAGGGTDIAGPAGSLIHPNLELTAPRVIAFLASALPCRAIPFQRPATGSGSRQLGRARVRTDPAYAIGRSRRTSVGPQPAANAFGYTDREARELSRRETHRSDPNYEAHPIARTADIRSTSHTSERREAVRNGSQPDNRYYVPPMHRNSDSRGALNAGVVGWLSGRLET